VVSASKISISRSPSRPPTSNPAEAVEKALRSADKITQIVEAYCHTADNLFVINRHFEVLEYVADAHSSAA
jgi:hypothetical protein